MIAMGNKAFFAAITISVILISTVVGSLFVKMAKAEPKTIVVPIDYLTIQGAINTAVDGDTILVKSGIYHENLVVDKAISLVGENRNTTIIDAGGKTVNIVEITASHVKISGFTIQNNTLLHDAWFAGIYVKSEDNNVTFNTITNVSLDAIKLDGENNTIIRNNVFHCLRGITVNSNGNEIIENNIISSAFFGIALFGKNNTFFHNNIIGNSQPFSFGQGNYWDNGSEGNFWADPTMNVTFIRTLYNIPDNHPLANPYGISASQLAELITVSNTSPTIPSQSPTPIPTPLLSPTPSIIFSPSLSTSITPSPLIPEFPLFIVAALMISAIIVTTILYKGRHSKIKQV
jgi:parallel beta-helix repeat protein